MKGSTILFPFYNKYTCLYQDVFSVLVSVWTIDSNVYIRFFSQNQLDYGLSHVLYSPHYDKNSLCLKCLRCLIIDGTPVVSRLKRVMSSGVDHFRGPLVLCVLHAHPKENSSFHTLRCQVQSFWTSLILNYPLF